MGKTEIPRAGAFRKANGVILGFPGRALQLGVVNQPQNCVVLTGRKLRLSASLLSLVSPRWRSGDSGLWPASVSLLTGSEKRGKGLSAVAVMNAIILISRWWGREAD